MLCCPFYVVTPALDPYDMERNTRTNSSAMIDLAPVAVVDAVRAQQARLRNPPVPMPELLDLFERLSSRRSSSCAA